MVITVLAGAACSDDAEEIEEEWDESMCDIDSHVQVMEDAFDHAARTGDWSGVGRRVSHAVYDEFRERRRDDSDGWRFACLGITDHLFYIEAVGVRFLAGADTDTRDIFLFPYNVHSDEEWSFAGQLANDLLEAPDESTRAAALETFKEFRTNSENLAEYLREQGIDPPPIADELTVNRVRFMVPDGAREIYLLRDGGRPPGREPDAGGD